MPVNGNFGSQSFNSFSGADIRATFGSKEIGELQAFSYAIQREKAPIYTMGHKNPRAFSRGKRGIAGTLVFAIFDAHALLEEMGVYNPTNKGDHAFLAAGDEYRPVETGGIVSISPGDETFDLVGDDTSIDFEALYSLQAPWYVDQIPPFDITVIGANEYGATVSMRVLGVELLNEGTGVSVDDIMLEQQMTYVARAMSPWRRTKKWHLRYEGAASTVVSSTI